MKLTAFSGSLRKASYNRHLLNAAIELAPADLTIVRLEIDDIPLFNADAEDPPPAAVAALRASMADAAGLLIVSPEYNAGVPAVTKNVVDWLSRPPRRSVLDGKPVAVLGASPGITGSARGQSQLRQAFVFTNSPVMPQPEVLVYRAHEKFDEEGRLTDERTRAHLEKFLQALVEWIGRFRESS